MTVTVYVPGLVSAVEPIVRVEVAIPPIGGVTAVGSNDVLSPGQGQGPDTEADKDTVM